MEAAMTIVNGMRPIHPGEILREEFMIPLGLSANALAIALRVPAPRINDIARERRATLPTLHCAWRATLAPARNSGSACNRITT
jgi:hypothetical protein